MNIAIFTNNYLPNPYGVSTSVEGFRRSLIAMGHNVYVFAPHWGGEVNDESGENIYRYPSIKMPTKIEFFMVIPHSSKVDDILNTLDIDIIHAQHPNLLGAVASKWALKKEVPLVFTWHSLYDRYAHYMPLVPDNISAKWAMKNAAAFARECDHVIVPTKSIIDVIRSAGVKHDRVSIVPSGVDEEFFAHPDGGTLRNKYGISEKQIVITTISRLTEEKNVLFLARSIAHVLADNRDVVFLCGGEGDLIDEIQDIFDDRNVLSQVIFTGKVSREDVKHYLHAGDFFVYASTSETQGTIVTENMYVGKPIVAVGENGVGDIVENGVTGITVVENEKKFVAAAQKLIDEKELREKMAQNAYDLAREKYTTTVCTKKLLTIYQEAISFHQKTQ